MDLKIEIDEALNAFSLCNDRRWCLLSALVLYLELKRRQAIKVIDTLDHSCDLSSTPRRPSRFTTSVLFHSHRLTLTSTATQQSHRPQKPDITRQHHFAQLAHPQNRPTPAPKAAPRPPATPKPGGVFWRQLL